MYALTMLTALLIAPSICVAQTRDISGSVFVDSNHNGVFDRGERGVAQVVVSNQDAVIGFHAERLE
jgi:hypothetical protein